MAMEMPARVEPVPGAIVAEFPWAAAGRTVRAFADASVAVRSHLGDRPAMIATISDWAGAYRDEFDTAYRRLTDVAEAVGQSLVRGADAVVRGAELANERQRQNNARAEAGEASRPGRLGRRMAM